MLSPSHHRIRLAVATVGAAVALLLTACASAPHAEPQPASPDVQAPHVAAAAEPTPVAAPDVTSAPLAAAYDLPPSPILRYALTCTELVPDRILVEAFGESSDVHSVPISAELLSPVGAGIRTEGGLACAFGNGQEEYTEAGYLNADYKHLTVELIPDHEEKWLTYATMGYPLDAADQKISSDSGTMCSVDDSEFMKTRICSSNVRVAYNWVELTFHGLKAPVGTTDAELLHTMRPVITQIVERIADPKPVDDTPSGRDALSCDVTLPVDQVLDVLGHPDAPGGRATAAAGGYSLMTAASEYSGVQRCAVGPADHTGPYASTSVLPNGAWAFGPAEAESGIALGSERVDVPGASAPSYLRCGTRSLDTCFLDLAVGHDWVRVTLNDPFEHSNRDKVLRLGALVVANLS